MTNSAEIINFPERESEQVQGREYVKADVDNGYYRVANEIGLALCKTHLNDSEGRIVHTVMYKTFGWNKAFDWVCYEQISELTGISVDNISKVKKRLVERKIIITDGKKMGINPVVSEWCFKSKQTQNTEKKISASRPINKSKQTLEPIQTDLKTSKSRPIQKKDTITKDTITKDNKSLTLPSWLAPELWGEFVAMRKSIKKPLTENATKRMLNKLGKFHDKGIDACAQLTNSIDNCYSDVYEPKNFQRQTHRPKTSSENFDQKDYGQTQIPEWMQGDLS